MRERGKSNLLWFNTSNHFLSIASSLFNSPQEVLRSWCKQHKYSLKLALIGWSFGLYITLIPLDSGSLYMGRVINECVQSGRRELCCVSGMSEYIINRIKVFFVFRWHARESGVARSSLLSLQERANLPVVLYSFTWIIYTKRPPFCY